MKAVYIGIDPSLENTAVCILDSKGSLVDTFQSKRLGLKSKYHYKRLLTLGDWFTNILHKHKCTYAGYENYSYGSTNTAFKLGELGGVLKPTLYTLSPGFALLPPTVLKQFATGSGAASKDEMVAQAVKECPELSTSCELTNDICDAYFLAKAALFIHDQAAAVTTGPELLRHRLEIIKKGKYERVCRDE